METVVFYVIAGVVLLFSMGVRQKLKSTYGRWSRVRSQTGLPGGEVARTILDANQLQSVPVEPVPGNLTDHYDPRGKQLRLARDNFVGNSVAATAVAAHECGHALQDADDYRPMEFRTKMVPIANAGARFGLPLAVAGSFFGSALMVQIGVLGYVGAMLLDLSDAASGVQREQTRPPAAGPARSRLARRAGGGSRGAPRRCYDVRGRCRVVRRLPGISGDDRGSVAAQTSKTVAAKGLKTPRASAGVCDRARL